MSVICLKAYRDTKRVLEILGPLAEEFAEKMSKVSDQDIEELKTILKPSKPRKRTERKQIGSMAWYPRLKRWKGCNGKATFNPANETAYSYDWWRFVERIDGLLVFNSYRYSVTTSSHQSAVRALLRELAIVISLEIEAPNGLQDLDSAVRHYQDRIDTLDKAIRAKGSRKAKNKQRKIEQLLLIGKIQAVLNLRAAKERTA